MKEKFTDSQLVDFLRRSYAAVDGLWFVKVEELHGVDAALDMDQAIWEIMPKIQGRKARELIGLSGTKLRDLAKAVQLKLTAEGYDYDADFDGEDFKLTINVCPWYEILKAKDRISLAEKIQEKICKVELAAWCKEFSPDLESEVEKRACIEDDCCDRCTIVFRYKQNMVKR